jgi:hypothetical protein
MWSGQHKANVPTKHGRSHELAESAMNRDTTDHFGDTNGIESAAQSSTI